MTILRGRVTSGIGDFSHWIEKLGDHYRRKTGLDLFPGTLNIEIEVPYHVPPNAIRLEAHVYGGRVSVNIVPCRIFDRPAFILRTDQNEAGIGRHPRTIVEIASDVKLREAHSLQDGDIVEVVVDP